VKTKNDFDRAMIGFKFAKQKHELYVDLLYNRLAKSGKYDVLETHVQYPTDVNPIGECDILGIIFHDKKNYINPEDVELHYYEVKTSKKHQRYGVNQLMRFKKYFKKKGYSKLHGFLYIGDDDLLIQVF